MILKIMRGNDSWVITIDNVKVYFAYSVTQ